MKRWTRDVVPKKTKVSSFDQDAAGNQVERASSIVREIMTATEYIVNRLVTNMDLLSLYRDQVIESKSKVDSADLPSESLDKNARLANILRVDQPCSSSSATILRPSGIRNKGCGSNKRLKSFREVSSSRISKKPKTRGCLICGGHGHNSRTCKKKTTGADSQNADCAGSVSGADSQNGDCAGSGSGHLSANCAVSDSRSSVKASSSRRAVSRVTWKL